jgi:hypothetical protein
MSAAAARITVFSAADAREHPEQRISAPSPNAIAFAPRSGEERRLCHPVGQALPSRGTSRTHRES